MYVIKILAAAPFQFYIVSKRKEKMEGGGLNFFRDDFSWEGLSINSYTVKENHIGLAVSKILELADRHT